MTINALPRHAEKHQFASLPPGALYIYLGAWRESSAPAAAPGRAAAASESKSSHLSVPLAPRSHNTQLDSGDSRNGALAVGQLDMHVNAILERGNLPNHS